MGTGSQPAESRRETEKERLDRNLQDLLQGLRVALPGVQVLFAFLLVVPFQQGFAQVTEFQKQVYFATLLCTAIASALLIGPSARHRARFRSGDKRWVVITGNRLATGGLVFLGAAMVGAILLVTDVLFASETAIAVAGALALILAWTWFAAPWIRAARGLEDDS